MLYGVGNGAEKLFACADTYGVDIKAIFSSDDRQSNQVFHGIKVRRLSEVLEEFPDPIILLAFGTEIGELIDRITELSKRFELYAPDLPVSDGPLVTDGFIRENADRTDRARGLLADEQSRTVFDRVLEYKSSGRIEPLLSCETGPEEKQGLIRLGEKEHFLDLGAYTGDTIDEFLDLTGGKYSEITALEANAKNYAGLVANKGNLERVRLLNLAAWDKRESVSFAGKNGRNFGILTDVPGKKKSPKSVQCISIDELGIDPSFVKMDIEGAERQAMEGMRETLNRCRPALQISVYHRTDDFFEIPLLLEELCPGYRMYLRHHRALPAWELQLYCVY